MLGFRKDNPESEIPKDGQYGKDVNGQWFGCAPGRFYCNLSNHEVSENSDGSITVAPSILITAHHGQWHGYLKNGDWQEC